MRYALAKRMSGNDMLPRTVKPQKGLHIFALSPASPTIVRMELSYPDSRSKIGAEINQKSFHSCGTVLSFAISVYFFISFVTVADWY